MYVESLFALAISANAPTPSDQPSPSLAFVENRGQWNDEALYRLNDSNLDYWVAKDGLIFDYNFQSGNVRDGHVVRLRFENAAPYAKAVGVNEMDGVENYYRNGNAALGVKRFESVIVENVVPGVSARYYLDAGTPRYDVILAPGADASKVAIRYEGAGNLRTNGEAVSFQTKFGEVRTQNLFGYQRIDGKIIPVPVSFQSLGANRIGFRVGSYDRTRPLVIDPQVVVRGSYLGGSSTDIAINADVVPGKFIAVSGSTSSADFPLSSGAYSSVIQDTSDAFVTVFDIRPLTSSETYPKYRLRYSTFVSAPGNQTATVGAPMRLRIRIREGGSVAVAMTANATGFPVNGSAGVITTDAPYQSTLHGSADAWVGLLDANGGTLYSGTYFGGGGVEILRDVDATGSGIVVAGFTSSDQAGGNPFPIVGSDADNTLGGSSDSFVSVLNAKCTSLIMSTYVGGDGGDNAYVVKRASNGSLWAAGATTSSAGFSGITGTSFDDSLGSNQDGFVANLSLSGKVNCATYLGSDASGNESINDLVESNGDVYVVGEITGNTMTNQAGSQDLAPANAFNPAYLGGVADAFVGRLNGSLTRKVAYTFLGGSSNDRGFAITTYGTTGRVAVTGDTTSSDMATTAGSVGGNSTDAFVVRLNNGLTSMLHGMRFGGSGQDSGLGIVESNELNNLTIVGTTFSSDLPFPAANAYDATNGAGEESGFIAEIGYFDDVQRAIFSRNPVTFGDATFLAIFFNIPIQNPEGQLLTVNVDDPSLLKTASGGSTFAIVLAQGREKYSLKLIPVAGPAGTYNTTVSVTSGGNTISVPIQVVR